MPWVKMGSYVSNVPRGIRRLWCSNALFTDVGGESGTRAGFSALSTGISCHSEIAAPYILHIGTEAQKQYWLPKMVSGEVVGAIWNDEDRERVQVQAMRSNAILQGEHYILNGSKTFISNGQHADLVVLAVKTDPKACAKGCFTDVSRYPLRRI